MLHQCNCLLPCSISQKLLGTSGFSRGGESQINKIKECNHLNVVWQLAVLCILMQLVLTVRPIDIVIWKDRHAVCDLPRVSWGRVWSLVWAWKFNELWHVFIVGCFLLLIFFSDVLPSLPLLGLRSISLWPLISQHLTVSDTNSKVCMEKGGRG